jgi:hypothetical protein
MEALGINNYNTSPNGKDNDRISSETFCQEAYVDLLFLLILFLSNVFRKTRLNELNATFHVQ